MKSLSILFILLLILFIPAHIFAQAPPCATSPNGCFIPCDGVKVPCDFNMLMLLISNIIGFVVKYLALPLATITIIYAGFIYLTTAITDQKAKARKMLLNVVIGFAVLLAAFIIVRTIVKVLAPNIASRIQGL